jgi:hypothetical protein
MNAAATISAALRRTLACVQLEAPPLLGDKALAIADVQIARTEEPQQRAASPLLSGDCLTTLCRGGACPFQAAEPRVVRSYAAAVHGANGPR